MCLKVPAFPNLNRVDAVQERGHRGSLGQSSVGHVEKPIASFCVPNPLALECDILSMDFYAFPAPVLSRVLTKVVQKPCKVTLIALAWATQPWFLQCLSLLLEELVRLLSLPDLLSQ